MTKSDLVAAIEASFDRQVHIESGVPDTDEYDVGFASLDDDVEITVGWDSGTRLQ